MRAYRLKHPNGTWSDADLSLVDIAKSVQRRMHLVEGPVHLREHGSSWGPWLKKDTATERLLNKLERGPVGFKIDEWNKNQKGVTARVVDVGPQPANSGGSPGVDLVLGFVQQRFPRQFEQWGIYNYRHIASSSSWSDHAYVNNPANWCGRAIDIHPNSMGIGDQIKAAIMAEEKITSRMRYLLWRVPDHFDHLHISMDDAGSPGLCR